MRSGRRKGKDQKEKRNRKTEKKIGREIKGM